ncbi:uncharacterized protein TNCV_3657091 [Trichonephila clavipes]|nr:uncharacterized protein TNCV_3657091 [Trichonephila clavipes]
MPPFGVVQCTRKLDCSGIEPANAAPPTAGVEGEYPGRSQGPLTSLPLLPTLRKDLRLDDYLEYPPVAKALYIYKHPCLLRDSKSNPTAQQSASLTTIPDG